MSASRINPQFNTTGATVPIPTLVPDAPGAVAAQGHSVWVAPSAGLLRRLDAATGSVQGLRQAVNYAIDRPKLAELGLPFQPLPGPTADHYLLPGTPGYRAAHIYPLHPDPARARRLVASAHARGSTAVLYTVHIAPLPDLAHIIESDLGAIGIQVRTKTFPDADRLYKHLATPGEPFDLAIAAWYTNYPDPSQMLNALLDGSNGLPSFNEPAYQRRLAAAARLSGPQRYLTYGALDLDLARNAAPLAAFSNPSSNDFFSARIGCQIFGPYGMDLAALCVRGSQHR
ncbi:MAG TPA: ABC transporter substrate-binding protein [Solirubrobacteraceae bacterium]|nr:ABC transporter substrate-binding protein [Solirubrobacteraceae bacterium]